MTPEAALAMFVQAGLQHLYYIFPLDNVASIKTYGILPLNEIKRRKISNASFALEEAQAWRDTFVVPLADGSQAPVHDLVPLYFNPCNPTLIKRKEMWKGFGIAIVPIPLLVPVIRSWTLADGNAASHKTHYWKGQDAVAHLDRHLLRASSWTQDPALKDEHKRRRCAELLASPSVPASCIERVVVYDYFAASRVHPHFKVAAEPSMFHDGPFAVRPT